MDGEKEGPSLFPPQETRTFLPSPKLLGPVVSPLPHCWMGQVGYSCSCTVLALADDAGTDR